MGSPVDFINEHIHKAVVGGYLFTMGWGVSKVCTVNAFVGLFCVVIILVLRNRVIAAERFRSASMPFLGEKAST